MNGDAQQWAEGLAAEGKLQEALGALHEALRHDRDNPHLHERMHQLLLMSGNRSRVLRHGPGYLEALVGARRAPEALLALQRLQALAADFSVPAACIVPMARAAIRARDYRTAIELLHSFDRRHPGHPDVPGAFLLSARIAREHLHRDDRAVAILKALLKRYPSSPLADDAVKYLASLSAAGPGKPWIEIAL